MTENGNDRLIAVAEKYSNDLECLNRIQNGFPRGGNMPGNVLRVHHGSIACSDLVVVDKSKFAEAEKIDRKVLGLEMESFSFLVASRLANVENPLVVKSVMDFADSRKANTFREYAKYTSTMFTLEVLDGLLSD